MEKFLVREGSSAAKSATECTDTNGPPSKKAKSLIRQYKEGCLAFGKNIDYFKRLQEDNSKSSSFMKSSAKVSERAQEVSYNFARLIAKTKNPYAIVETLILPACKENVRGMLGPVAEKEVFRVPLSDDTIRRRIDDMSGDIEATLVEKLRVAGKFAFQVDESTGIGSSAQIIASVRFVDERRIKDHYLFCKELPRRATGDEIFRVTDE
ncbi:protein FAM200C-like [Uloborus diversus]|uniref:protein FAM200C-like n=1 Tax=Uloborus diversus TaxID=327109 RepID=UPI00240A782C|nr:protein FAM200C-like [Uloborus diversus]